MENEKILKALKCIADRTVKEEFMGLTKREYIATMAMQGILASTGGTFSGTDVVADSVAIADKLLKELEK